MRSILPLFAAAFAMAAPALAQQSVPLPGFRSIELRGGGEVTVRPGPVQRLTIVEGSIGITHADVDRNGGLHIQSCDRRCPQDYHLRVEIESPHVPDLEVTGGGTIVTLGGFAPQHELAAAVTGGGLIDARSIDAADAAAAIHGGGQVLMRSRGTLAAAVNGGGEVLYWGNPLVSTAIHGGGSVQHGQ